MSKLNALTVRNAKPGSRLSDGGGLRLDIDAAGRGRWFFRYTSPTTRKERLAAFGPLLDVSLAAARELASSARSQIRKGVDPLDVKHGEREAVKLAARLETTFAEYAEQYIKAHEAAWRAVNHRRNWRNSLRDHALPKIGQMRVSNIDTDAILCVLRPIWTTKHETARNVRQRIEVILAAAKIEGLRAGENPAQWRGHLDHLLPRVKRVKKHFAALPYEELPVFWESLNADTSDAAVLLRFAIATCARYSEAANADWSEIDIEKRLWTIPASRMKAGREHVVPLSDEAMAALKASQTKEGLMFPSPTRRKPISDVALAKVIKRHTGTLATTHGFRSTFRDWAGDCTDTPREVAEGCLAHAVGNAVEQAYRRGTALEKRRNLLDAWSAFLRPQRATLTCGD